MIHVSVTILGEMQKAFSGQYTPLRLEEGATVQDVFFALEKRLNPAKAENVWNFTEHCFRGPVFVLIDGVAVWDTTTVLGRGQDIIIKRFFCGG